jgi:hypothetical protein
MSANGSWTILMKTPLGAQPATLHLISNGLALTGTIESRLGSGALMNGTIDGQLLTWAVAMKLPRPLIAEFRATLDGDALSGYAVLGTHGRAPFKGNRS